ncbi:glycoside hydrolase family 68 protein [Actinophytocola sp.]|uniref:glycoside hydrolase family 68 protein n=1 Tax=Actinophytocola sp. TaxID=1872138 RepID=UPI002D706254|nr:glycoside hydrolase family 68 protein [Actinophytocola sp.]HYQ64841.1 glycoside hydrolase family 68 protein [Actinophytocola sp.]
MLTQSPATTAPVIAPTPRVLPGHDIWDTWPVQEENGATTVVDGAELWMVLSAPATGHPDDRHDHARIRLLARTADRWHDLGNAFPDGASPGSREWSGSAVHRPDGSVSVFYTAAGRRGERRRTFHQQVVEARPRLDTTGSTPHLAGEARHRVLVHPTTPYLPADDLEGGPGRIRAFRDPGWFRDPADGHEYLLIAASVPGRDHFTGAVALARSTPTGWALLSPLVTADGVSHELERPHVVVHHGRYYLFFCTNRQVFPRADITPTGLYGFVAPSLTGPYEALNGSGLVIQNPPAQPDQAYAWLVLPDLRVESFVDYLPGPAASARDRFGGTAAPTLTLVLHETTTTLAAADRNDDARQERPQLGSTTF